MKKISVGVISLVLFFVLSPFASAQGTHSGEAVKESGNAASAGSKSAAHAIAASGQVTSAASAVPLSVSGAVGGASGQIGKDLMDAATGPIGKPLAITDETITVGPPPDQALKVKQTKENNL
jgi:hypothetical protein